MSKYWIMLILELLTISVFCLTPDEIEAQSSGWSVNPRTQYHIQTDEGPERYFKFQTLNGQYRKEKRLQDGTVVGTEGWLDPLGYLRIKDYIADREGFRILKSKTVFVGKDRPINDAVTISRRVLPDAGVLVKPRRPPNPFRRPSVDEVSDNGIEEERPSKIYHTYQPPTRGFSNYYSSTIPPITIDATYDEIPKPIRTYVPSYKSRNAYTQSYKNAYPYAELPQPLTEIQPPFDDPKNSLSQVVAASVRPEASYDIYRPVGRRYRTVITSAGLNNRTKQDRNRRQNYSIERSDNPAAGTPIYYVNNIPKTRDTRYSKSPIAADHAYPQYDGIHTTSDGFQYYLKTHYHEEEAKPHKTVGSYGYVDPFGIRRVVYYKADGENGFVHRKNNRYVGFNATPYDPVPSKSN